MFRVKQLFRGGTYSIPAVACFSDEQKCSCDDSHNEHLPREGMSADKRHVQYRSGGDGKRRTPPFPLQRNREYA